MHYWTTPVKPFASWVNYGDVPYSSNFWVCAWNPMVWPFKWHLFSSTDFHMVFFNMQQVLLVTFDKILQKLPLKWSLLRTFLWCFPFSIHKFSKLILRLFKTEFWFRTLKLIRLIRQATIVVETAAERPSAWRFGNITLESRTSLPIVTPFWRVPS